MPVKNEIAFPTYITKSIPVPKVYTYDIRQSGPDSPYFAMGLTDGQLYYLWYGLKVSEKASIANKVADVIVKWSETNLGRIGYMTLKHGHGHMVEGFELFKGRVSRSLCQGGLRRLVIQSGTNIL